MKKINQLLCIVLSMHCFMLPLLSQAQSEWRGVHRTGHYPDLDLLDTWPEEGPVLLWQNTELPKGFSSVSFNETLLYLTGIEDSSDVLVALDTTGNIRWKTPFGRAWTDSFSDSRGTPTVEENRVYVASGMGDLACVDAHTGELIWGLRASEEYGGSYGSWGVSESLLVDQEKVYFTPGGMETTTIALDKRNGELLWKSESLKDNPGYVSPIFIEHSGGTYLLNVTASYIFALDVSDGRFAWKVRHIDINSEKSFEVYHSAPQIKCVSPLYHNGQVYVTGGYDHGGMMLQISESGDAASMIWYDSVLDVHTGGVVMMDGKIYGSNWINNGDGNWCCLDWDSGEILYEEHWNNKGSVIAADSMLYIYEEKRGHVALVAPGSDRFEVISSFRISEGSGPHWAHPVIQKGRLYIRHGNALMVYDIS